MVTLAILGTLALLVVPATQLHVQRAKEAELQRALTDIRRAIDAYRDAALAGQIPMKAGSTGYPENLDVLAQGVVDQSQPERRLVYFLRRVPRDPFHEDANTPAAGTWGLRSYASDANDPQEGEDVFDVYSRSERVGLNGVPYRKW